MQVLRQRSFSVSARLELRSLDEFILQLYYCDTNSIRLRYVNHTEASKTMLGKKKNSPMNFKTMNQVDVPQGRHGKHNGIVTKVLSDLDQVRDGVALKIPLAGLAESKEKIRAALSRATRKAERKVATAADAEFLYIWNEK